MKNETPDKDPPELRFRRNPFKWGWRKLCEFLSGFKFWKFNARDWGIWNASSWTTLGQVFAATWLWSNAKMLVAKAALFSKTFVSALLSLSH